MMSWLIIAFIAVTSIVTYYSQESKEKLSQVVATVRESSFVRSFDLFQNTSSQFLVDVKDVRIKEGQLLDGLDINLQETGKDFDGNKNPATYQCELFIVQGGQLADRFNCHEFTGISFDQSSGKLSWKTDYNQAGDYSVFVTGRAGERSDRINFYIKVVNVNRKPDILFPTDNSFFVGEKFKYDFNDKNTQKDIDLDGDKITYLCSMVSVEKREDVQSCDKFNPYDGTIEMEFKKAGRYNLTLIVKDGQSEESKIFVLEVLDKKEKRAEREALGQRAEGIPKTEEQSRGETQDYYPGQFNNMPAGNTNTIAAPTANSSNTTSGNGTSAQGQGSNNGSITFAGGNSVVGSTTANASNSSNGSTPSGSGTQTLEAPSLADLGDMTSVPNTNLSFDVNDHYTQTDYTRSRIAVTYQCYVGSQSCEQALGASFNQVSGVFSWIPTYAQIGSYAVSITASAGVLRETKKINVEITTDNLAPELAAIGDQTVNENVAITPVDAQDLHTGNDNDRDGDAITYTCFYDSSINGSVSNATNCSSLAGVSLNSSTGVFAWTPSYAQSGTYEFKIVGKDARDSDDEIFSVTVINVNLAPELAAIADSTVSEMSAVTINAKDTHSNTDFDRDAQAISYTCYYDTSVDAAVVDVTSCTALTGVSFNTSTGVLSWTPSYTQSGSYEFKITGSDGSLNDDEIFSITVNDTNAPPELAAIGDQTVSESVAITSINAQDTHTGNDTDRDGTAIIYSCYYDSTINGTVSNATACSDLTGITFNVGTGVFNWTPDNSQSGTYEFKIVGSDGILSDDEIFSIIVIDTNLPPVLTTIADQTVAENVAVTTIDAQDTHTGNDTDRDGTAITYSCYYDTVINATVSNVTSCTALTGVSFNTTIGVFDWTPSYTQSGSYEFKIVGSDGSLSDDEIFAVTVTNVNRAPELATINDETVSENVAITTINAQDTHTGNDTDRDGTAITYSCYYDTTIDASVANATECTTITGLSFNTSTGVLNWTPSYAQSGTYEFKIIGSDGSLTGDEIFAITVINVNRAPDLASINDVTVNEMVAITTINAKDTHTNNDTDRDGTAITYSCYYDSTIDVAVASVTACTTLAGVSFNTTTGVFDWTPSYAQSGVYEFMIVGSDGALTDDEIFSITVNNVNAPPVLATINDQTVNEAVAITTIDAQDIHTSDDTDRDGTAITYSCYYDLSINGAVASASACTSLTGVSFNTSTGVFDWTPNNSQSGTYEFKIVGSDGSLSDDEIFAITVSNANLPPELASIGDQTVNENVAISSINAQDTHTGNDTDRDGQTITYSCYYDSTVDATVASVTACTALTGVSFNTTTGVFTWTPSYTQSGTYEFKIVGSDGSLTGEELFSVTVNNVDRAPELAAIADQTVSENAAITTINAKDTHTNNDTDRDGQTITYSCYYDSTIDAAVASVTACTALTGVSFDTTTGVFDWTPSFTQSGTYEFKIIGSDGSLTDDEIFAITVNNTNRAPDLAAIGDQTVNENAAITTVDANDTHTGDDTDRDGTALTYSCYYDSTINGAVASATACTSLTGVSFNTSSGVFDWTPSYTQSGTYEFKIVGSDGSLTDDEIFSITVTNVNRAPELATIGDQTVNENVAISSINAQDTHTGNDTDRDGTAITYSCYYDTVIDAAVASVTGCTTLSGVAFNTTTGVMTWTPSFAQSGTYEFKIIGSDGSLTDDEIFSITVSNVDRAPELATIADQTVNENVAITTVNAQDTHTSSDTDRDGQAITYSCYYDTSIDATVANVTACTALTGLSFNTTTGVFDWTPSYTQSGSYEFKIIGSDGSLTDDEIFAVTVNNVNRAPELAAIADQTVSENAAITTVNANDTHTGDDTDRDGQTITYSCYYDSTIDAAVASVTACTALTGVSFNTTTGAFDWTPSYAQSGTYEFKIVGTDGSLSDDEIFAITVNNTNRPPLLDAIANQTVNENSAVAAINASDVNTGNDTDIDGQTITYSCYYDNVLIDGSVASVFACTGLTGVTFNTTTGVFAWTPNYSQAGDYEFIIIGSDGSLSDDEYFSITVNNTNRAPELAAIADQTVNENVAITAINAQDTHTGNDTDRDGDTITYTCYYDTAIDASVGTATTCATLSGVSFNTSTGVMTWTPSYTQSGTYEFIIYGSDGSLSDDAIFAVTVTNANRAPVLATISAQSTASGTNISIDASDTNTSNDTDRDGDTITYVCYYDTAVNGAVATTNACSTLSGVTFTASTGVFDWTPTAGQIGTYEIKITGSDGSLTDDEIFSLTVTRANVAPELDAIANITGVENSLITVNANDLHTGDDIDRDGDVITYTCYYDTVIDGAVGTATTCASIAQIKFVAATGAFSWSTNYADQGSYEFKIIGTEAFASLTDDELFTITITDNTGSFPLGVAKYIYKNAQYAASDASGNIYVIDQDFSAVHKYNSAGTYVLTFGSAGTGDGQFTNAKGITVDSSGNIYVVDTGSHRVQKFDSTGAFVTKWGASGSGNGQFSSPTTAAVDSSNNIYVTDTSNHRIQKFTSAGVYVTKWGSNGSTNGLFSSPTGIAIDSQDNVYVADNGNHRVQKFDVAGTYVTKWGTSGSTNGKFSGPTGIATDASNYVYVVDAGNSRIQKFNSVGDFFKKWGSLGTGNGQFSAPVGIAVGTDASVYVVESTGKRMQKFDLTGNFLASLSPKGTGLGLFNQPYEIDQDSLGNLYVSDLSNHRVHKYNSAGKYLLSFGTNGTGNGQFTSPAGICVDKDDNIYVVDNGNKRIVKFDSSGNYILKWGSVGTGDGQFTGVTGIDTDSSGNVYTVEATNNRVQKFDSSGTFIAKWGSSGSGDGQFSSPYGIAIDASDNLIVVDTSNHRIQKFTTSGVFVSKFGTNGTGSGQFALPHMAAFDSSGNLYVGDTNNNRIQKFNGAGTFVTKWGTNGPGLIQFGLNGVFGVTVDDDGNVYTTDIVNHRVQKFDSSGNPLTN